MFGVFDSDEQAESFRDKHGSSVSVDIIKGVTNKWIMLETNEECADKIKYNDKNNEILEDMIK